MIKQKKIQHTQEQKNEQEVINMNISKENSQMNQQQYGVSPSTAAGSSRSGEYPHRVNPPDQYQYKEWNSKEHYHYHPYKKLYRSTTDKWLGGVCGGIAKYFGKDPVLIRLLWVVVTLLSAGAGVIGYILFWLFVDKEPVQFIETNQYTTKGVNGSVHVHHHYRPTE
jgi:phage shock protein PspC (stress-responsive transcriptional regulator)